MGPKNNNQERSRFSSSPGGYRGKGGASLSSRFPNRGTRNPGTNVPPPPQFRPETFNNPYANVGFGQQPPPQSTLPVQPGMGGKGGQMQGQQPQPQQYQPPQGGMGGKGGQMPPQGGMGGKGGQMPTQGGYGGKGSNAAQFYQAAGQPSGLAALQQPTATTQAVAPEQPYMGNYLQ